jgi:hypothetical protein
MGKEWVNGVVKSLTKLVGTNHVVTSAYRPNTNGLQNGLLILHSVKHCVFSVPLTIIPMIGILSYHK